MYQILYHWYPHNLFYTSGGWHGTKIVFFVDMVLGPALTLILANPKKSNKELIRDLGFCAVLQICALAYGVAQVVSNKPVALSIHNGAIYTVQQDHIKNLPDKTVFSHYTQKPPLIYTEDTSRYDLSIPELKKKAQNLIDQSMKLGVPVHAVPSTFDKIENHHDELEQLTSESLQAIKNNELYNEIQFEKINRNNWYVLPIDGSFENGYMAFDKSGNIKESICCH